MVETYAHFQKRLKSLGKKHAKMYNGGYTTAMRKDGLIIAKPVRRSRIGFPFKGLLLVVLGFFAFKAFMLSSLGEVTYSDRLDVLASGTTLEQGGAYVMQIDPVTQIISEYAAKILG